MQSLHFLLCIGPTFHRIDFHFPQIVQYPYPTLIQSPPFPMTIVEGNLSGPSSVLDSSESPPSNGSGLSSSQDFEIYSFAVARIRVTPLDALDAVIRHLQILLEASHLPISQFCDRGIISVLLRVHVVEDEGRADLRTLLSLREALVHLQSLMIE